MVMQRMIWVVAVVMVLAGCNRGTADPSTTTEGPAPTPTVGFIPPSTTSTSTTIPETVERPPVTLAPVEYEVRYRAAVEGGDLLVVLIPPAAYDDLGLERIIRTVVEDYPAATAVRVIDDIGALRSVTVAEAEWDDEDRAMRDAHYLVELVDGIRLEFHGPFESLTGYSLGS